MNNNTHIYNKFFIFFILALLTATLVHMYFGLQLVPGSMDFITIFFILISLIASALFGFFAVCFKFLAVQNGNLATPVSSNYLQKAMVCLVVSSLLFIFLIPPTYNYFRASVGNMAEAINGGFYLLYGWIGGYGLLNWGLWLNAKTQISNDTTFSKSPILIALLASASIFVVFGLLWWNELAVFGNLSSPRFEIVEGFCMNMLVQALFYGLFSIFLWLYTSPHKSPQ